MDGLRGIAILLVLAFHFTPATGPLYFLAYVCQVGWIGVDLFFVLSGYLITGILLDSVGHTGYYRNFIIRRSLRIFPLYYVCLALYCILTYYPDPIRWKDFLNSGGGWWYASYLGNIKAPLDGHWPAAGLLTPLWSLQVEEQFYLTFPLLVSLLKRKILAMVLIAAVGLAFVLRAILTLAIPDNLLWAYTLMPCRMDALAMGGLIAIVKRDSPHWLKGRWIGWITLLSAAIFVTDYLYSRGSLWTPSMRTLGYSAIDLAFAGLLVMLIGRRQPVLLALCRWRFLIWVGTISYGLYLLHIPARTILRRFAPLAGISQDGSAESVISFAAAICAAWISWKIFESPISKLKDRFAVR